MKTIKVILFLIVILSSIGSYSKCRGTTVQKLILKSTDAGVGRIVSVENDINTSFYLYTIDVQNDFRKTDKKTVQLLSLGAMSLHSKIVFIDHWERVPEINKVTDLECVHSNMFKIEEIYNNGNIIQNIILYDPDIHTTGLNSGKKKIVHYDSEGKTIDEYTVKTINLSEIEAFISENM